MNTTFYFIRHGEVNQQLDSQGRKLTYGPDAILSSQGERQIEYLGQSLAAQGVRLDAIYTGPFARAIKTAQIIASRVGIPPIYTDTRLQDSYVPGWRNLPEEELPPDGDVFALPPRSEDQETLEQIAERMLYAVHYIRQAEEGRVIGVIVHGDPFRALLYGLENPGLPVNRETVTGKPYIQKGYAIKIVVDEHGRIKEKEPVLILEKPRKIEQ